ncbi:siderophore-interacting protein [Frigoribacterium sp. 2-23]|uniref:siderophore-interacting protein n=1 Tax=Frigoribacterium sp. 2-23 TaxID=3415006 RepID=UPI003C6EE9A1
MPETKRPVRPQHLFVVERTEQLTPHLVRVHLGGDAFDAFVAAGAAQLDLADPYVKLLLPRPGSGLRPPFDLDDLRSRVAPEQLPVRRTYTVRSVDHGAKTIAIDFVVHGDEGVAGPWAAVAQPGDVLSMSSPGAGWSPMDDASTWHVLAGDESALPAIASGIEAMSASTRGVVIVEVENADDELDLAAPSGVEVQWLHRLGRPHGAPLMAALRALETPPSPLTVFAHGERGAMKEARVLFQEEWGVERAHLSLSAYWALGRAEDRFQAEKAEPIGAIFPA